MINNVIMHILFKCKELLSGSKIHHDFKVHWEFLKGKSGCSTLKRWLQIAGGCSVQDQFNAKCQGWF